MNYIEFQQSILKIVKKKMGKGYSVTIDTVSKNNDIELVAIIIRKNGDICPVPTIYLEDFYDRYSSGLDIEDIANQIICIYQKNVGKISISLEEFTNFQKIKDKIMIKLVNYDRNKENLKKIPHRKVLDLAVIYYILWDENEEHEMTAVINDSHIDTWGINSDLLYVYAYENTMKKLSFDIRDMKDVVESIYNDMKVRNELSTELELEILDELDSISYPMYVLSNKKRILGAATILYDLPMKYFYEKFGGPFYVLPSSIHEVIVVPKIDMPVHDMVTMVTEINENEVDYMEVLSDNVYCYDGENMYVAE